MCICLFRVCIDGEKPTRTTTMIRWMTTLWSLTWRQNVTNQKADPAVDLDSLTSRGFYSVKRAAAFAIIVVKRGTGRETVENQRKVRHHSTFQHLRPPLGQVQQCHYSLSVVFRTRCINVMQRFSNIWLQVSRLNLFWLLDA